jgi:hypothetical protein
MTDRLTTFRDAATRGVEDALIAVLSIFDE